MNFSKLKKCVMLSTALCLCSTVAFATELPEATLEEVTSTVATLSDVPDVIIPGITVPAYTPEMVQPEESVPEETVPEETVPEEVVPEIPVDGYLDVNEGDWYKVYVDYATDLGLIDGVYGYFYPNAACSRGVIANALATLSGASLENLPSSTMTDVVGTEYEKAVVWCVQNGVMSGISDTYFGVGDALTREQFAVALLGFMHYEKVYMTPSTTKFFFNDSWVISSWAYPGVVWAVENGLLFGNDNYLSPRNNVSRAELATMLYRYDVTEKSSYYDRTALVNFACSFLGYPYAESGTSPITGFDCAGFAHYVYLSCGLEVPSTPRALYSYGTHVDLANVQPGDLFFFGSYTHAAIYIGGNRYIHANSSEKTVSIWDYSHSYFKSSFTAARKVI